MVKCVNCGAEYETEEYVFCPECGGRLMQEKKKSKKKIGIICAAAAVVIIAVVSYFGITATRELTLNCDKGTTVAVGDTLKVSAYADGLTSEDYRQIQWTSHNGTFQNNGDGSFTVMYDKNDFSPDDSSYASEDLDENSYEAFIDADLKKGIRTWHGEIRVVVTLEPQEFKSGKIVREPMSSRDSQIVINAMDKLHSYFYLKSETSEENDISFIIKKGESTTVEIPCDTYTIYEADGENWYGDLALFGPSTTYIKWDDKMEFTEDDYWTLSLNVENGNAGVDNVNPEDFPDAQ